MPEKIVGQTKDTGFQLGVRKTLPFNHQQVWDFFFSPGGLLVWLGPDSEQALDLQKSFSLANGISGKTTVWQPLSHIRLQWKKEDWENTSRLQVRIYPSGKKTVIAFHQEMLAGPEQRAAMKTHWKKVLDQLSKELAATS
jgi:hypothetical protein